MMTWLNTVMAFWRCGIKAVLFFFWLWVLVQSKYHLSLEWDNIISFEYSVTHCFDKIQCVQKKRRPKCFFIISSRKLGQFWWNLVHCFLNKFALKLCKCFLPYPSNVSTLPCETWNAHWTQATIELLQKETPEFIPPQLGSPSSPYLNPVDYSTWRLLQEKVYRTCITDLDELKQRRRTEWGN